MALVTLDLGRTFGMESMNIVRERVQKSSKVNHVSFSASHTHSGPVIDETYAAGKRPEWEVAAPGQDCRRDRVRRGQIGTGRDWNRRRCPH